MGFTTRAFRIQCVKYGAGFVFTPMEHSEKINFDKKTINNIKPVAEETPCGVQLVGSSEKSLINAVEKVEKFFPLIDLNFGCPSKKIIGSKSGAWFLKDLKKMRRIISSVASVTTKPVTVKTRIGFDSPQIEKIIKTIDVGGASAIIIHGRTVKQGYSGESNWELIKKAKKIASIPIVGNGDVKNAIQGKQLIEQGFSDFVMIGRNALGNPIVFSETVVKKTKTELLKEFIKLNETTGFNLTELKTQIIQFIKGMRGASKIRKELSEAKKISEIELILEKNFLT